MREFERDMTDLGVTFVPRADTTQPRQPRVQPSEPSSTERLTGAGTGRCRRELRHGSVGGWVLFVGGISRRWA